MTCRKLIEGDIAEVTNIHFKAFADFFLSEMGESFLLLYYKSLIKNDNGFGFGVFNEEGKLLGFSVATIYSKGFNRNLILNNIVSFSVIGLKLLLSKPKSLLRLFRNLSKKGLESDDGNYSELFSIAVDPEMQGRGVGKMLLKSTEKEALDAGCHRITLTTDYYNNSEVFNFYTKLGYTVFYDFIAYPNRKMYKMIKNLI